MDEYFQWRADPTGEASADEKTSLNGKQATEPTAMPAYIEDLAERWLHNFRDLIMSGESPSRCRSLLSPLLKMIGCRIIVHLSARAQAQTEQ